MDEVAKKAIDVCCGVVNWLNAVRDGGIRADESTVKIVETIAGYDAREVVRALAEKKSV